MAESRFTDFVDLYDKYRLSYNSDTILETIKYISNFIKIENIADIGSGTGILTLQLLKYKFNKYYAVEPNIAMQECSINKDKKDKIIHLNNMSNNTDIPAKTIDIIFVGTAIHWFEPQSTLKEFKRILKPNGFLVLLHGGANDKTCDDILNLNKKYKDYINNRESDTRYANNMSNYSNKFYTIIGRNPIILTQDQFMGLHMSFSTSPKKTDKIYDKFVEELKNIYNTHAQDNKLTLSNKTTILISNELFKK